MPADFSEQRKNLVNSMEQYGAIESEEVKNAFLKVQREIFFSIEQRQYSYADSAFPIGKGQTISQPSTIAVMLELLEAKKGLKVFEVGSGCGYVLALLSELVGAKGKVFGIELVPELAVRSIENLRTAGVKNAFVEFGDGTKGMPKEAPFDGILVSAAAEEVPEALIEQLAPNGRLVAPVGPRHTQQMAVIRKDKNGQTETLFPAKGYFVVVPLK
ncbi:MAG: protein-L-isoaspartate(D-aspartate) O-methyltransferase [Candidatus Diapherotrites archaeon]|nr:protein-L-isoaspartate(D-aspartate) O-methyltransferase [Candidatus Diapherotrites archaeon]